MGGPFLKSEMAETEKISSGYAVDPHCIPGFVLHVIERLNNAGFNAYLVGGAVRDILSGRPVADWDIATSASNVEISVLFHDVRNFTLKHETVTLVWQGTHYEVTSTRGADRPGISIEEDLGHRDFTINAMAYDPSKGVILDPYNGRQDLKKRIIRAVADPCERFNEDPLRLLRAVRIAVELGFRIEGATMKAIHDMSAQLTLSAQERIRDELMKILLVQRPSSGLKLLKRFGLLEQILPELMEGVLKRQNRHHRYTIFRHTLETVDMVEPDPVLRLAALFHDIAKPRVRKKINDGFRFHGHAEESALLACEIMERLRFSKELIRKTANIVNHHMVEYKSHWSNGAIRRLIRRFEPDPIDCLLSFRRADLLAHGVAGDDLVLLSELEGRINALRNEPIISHVRDLALDGEKVMEILGLSPGPEVGKALDFLMEKVIDQPELNTEEALKSLLEEMRY